MALVLKPGSRGPRVRDLQERLARLGLYSGPVDGFYGPLTFDAVRDLQRRFRLRPDGLAGPQVWAVLRDGLLPPAALQPAGVQPGGGVVSRWVLGLQEAPQPAPLLPPSPAGALPPQGLPPQVGPLRLSGWVLRWARLACGERGQWELRHHGAGPAGVRPPASPPPTEGGPLLVCALELSGGCGRRPWRRALEGLWEQLAAQRSTAPRRTRPPATPGHRGGPAAFGASPLLLAVEHSLPPVPLSPSPAPAAATRPRRAPAGEQALVAAARFLARRGLVVWVAVPPWITWQQRPQGAYWRALRLGQLLGAAQRVVVWAPPPQPEDGRPALAALKAWLRGLRAVRPPWGILLALDLWPWRYAPGPVGRLVPQSRLSHRESVLWEWRRRRLASPSDQEVIARWRPEALRELLLAVHWWGLGGVVLAGLDGCDPALLELAARFLVAIPALSPGAAPPRRDARPTRIRMGASSGEGGPSVAARIREEQVWLSRHLEERLAETTASGTLRLPGELPDVARAVHWRGFACVEKVTAQPQLGWVEASGRVRVWVSYVAAGSESPDPAAAVWGGRLEGELPFTYRLDAGTFHDSARWSVRAQVGAVDGRFRADGRTADVDVVLQLAFQGVERQPTRLVTHASSTGPCRIEASTTLLRTSLAEALERTRFQVSDERELGTNLSAGAGRPRVVEVEAAPTITQARVEAGTVSVEGVVRFDVLFVQPRPARAAATAPEPADAAEAASPEAAGGAERGWEVSCASWTSGEAFRFTLPVEQARPGDTVRARATAADVVARPAGGSRFAFDVEVELEVGLYSSRAVQVATDVRGCEQLPVEQRKSTVTVEQWLAELRRSFAASATLELPAGLPPVERVLWAGVTLHPHPPRPDGPRVLVSASCTPWMFYVPYKADARTGGLGFVEWTGAMALEQPLALPELRPGAQLACSVSFAGVAVEADLINRQTVELSVAGTLLLGGRQAHAQEVVAEAVAIQARAQDPPPFFYLVVTQAGDTLWKLSRRYDVPVQALVEANPELQAVPAEEPLAAGRKLFVRRRG